MIYVVPAVKAYCCRQGDIIMVRLFIDFLRNQSGATSLEYGLIASCIGLAVISSVQSTGTKLKGTFGKITNNLS